MVFDMNTAYVINQLLLIAAPFPAARSFQEWRALLEAPMSHPLAPRRFIAVTNAFGQT